MTMAWRYQRGQMTCFEKNMGICMRLGEQNCGERHSRRTLSHLALSHMHLAVWTISLRCLINEGH